MAGVIGTGQGHQKTALSGFVRASEQEKSIDSANEQLASAEKGQKASLTGSGAATGAMIGASSAYATAAATGAAMSWSPVGWGILAGAGIGYLLSELF